jgi:hypothetical protein
MADRYVSEQAERRVHRFGRLGYLTYGVVQLVLAVLTFQLAWGSPPQDASTSGAIQTMAQQPAGQVLVWVVAVGMAVLASWQGYVAWAMNDGVWASASAAATALTYAVVAGLAVRFAVGGSGGGGGGGDTGEQAAATLFDLPGGRWIVAALGLAAAGVGVRQAVKGATSGFVDDLEAGATKGRTGTWVLWLGRVGYAAKGIALVLVGALFVTAAATRDADEAGGLDQALTTLREQPAGPALLTAIGVGFAAYGLYCIARARYERQ